MRWYLNLQWTMVLNQKHRKKLAKLIVLAEAHDFLFNKRRRTRRRRRRLLAAGLLSRKKRTHRSDIQPPSKSFWSHFCNSPHSEEAWIDKVGLPGEAFYELVESCEEIWRTTPLRTQNGVPRPCDLVKRHLDCAGTVGLLLMWMITCSKQKDVCDKFNIIDTVCQKYLEFAVSILLPVLRRDERARIHWETNNIEYLERMATKTRLYTPELHTVYGQKVVGYVDGTRFRIHDKWSRPADRKGDKSGEKKLTLRKIIFVFDPDNRCVACVLNSPGSWHDSKCATKSFLYKRAEQLPDGYCILADTAFKGHLRSGKIIRILKVGQYLPVGMGYSEMKHREERIIRARQPSEWGNRAFRSFALQLSVAPLGTDDFFNTRLMELAVLLHNYRISTCTRNQLKRFFENLEKQALNPNVRVLFDSDNEDEESSGDTTIDNS